MTDDPIEQLRAKCDELCAALAEALDGWEEAAYYSSEHQRIRELREKLALLAASP